GPQRSRSARAMIVRVAAVQAEVASLDLGAMLDKTRLLLTRAAAEGARLVAFPETWLPGYPAWLDCCRDVGLWDHPPMKPLFVRVRENAVRVPGPVTAALGALAREHDLVLSIGVQERVDEGPGRGTLYNTMLTFAPDGSLLNRYRKLMPTFTERLVWGG